MLARALPGLRARGSRSRPCGRCGRRRTRRRDTARARRRAARRERSRAAWRDRTRSRRAARRRRPGAVGAWLDSGERWQSATPHRDTLAAPPAGEIDNERRDPDGLAGPRAAGNRLACSSMSLVREPTRQQLNAILVAGAGFAYMSGGLGFFEYAFIPAAISPAFSGCVRIGPISVAWFLHVGWDIVHHLYGNPIWPWMPLSSLACATLDTLIGIWFLAGAPSVYALLRDRHAAARSSGAQSSRCSVCSGSGCYPRRPARGPRARRAPMRALPRSTPSCAAASTATRARRRRGGPHARPSAAATSPTFAGSRRPRMIGSAM